MSTEEIETLRKNLSKDCADIWPDNGRSVFATRILPIGHALVIRRDPPLRKIGLIHIDVLSEEASEGQCGTVLALGLGKDEKGRQLTEERYSVAIGERVVLFKHGGSRVEKRISGDELTYCIEARDVLGKVEDDAAQFTRLLAAEGRLNGEELDKLFEALRFAPSGSILNEEWIRAGSEKDVQQTIHPACVAND